MSIRKQILWRIYLTFGFICLAGIAIIFQSFRIQNLEGNYWRGMAESLTTAYRSIEPPRGNIKSEGDRLLATSLPFFEIRMDVNSDALTDEIFDENVGQLAKHMSYHFKKRSANEYKQWLVSARKRGERYLLIKRKVTYPELQLIKSWPLFKLGKYKGGLIVNQQNKRIMPFKLLANRSIGYVREGIQPVGLEGKYDSILAGVQGKRLMQKIAGGVWIPINDENEIEPVPGKDIITTLDVNLQDVAEYALLKTLKKHKADHGCVVVMEVKTGKIKAIANLGHKNDHEYWETYNYAVGESSEPGSTFKLAAMLALLEDGYLDINDSIDLEKGIKKYYNETIKDAKKHNLNMVTVQRAFEISSNVGISKMINHHYKDKPEQFIKHLRDMSLDKKIEIEIKGEPVPFIKTPQHKDWSGVSLPFMSIGYEVKLTPLQMLTLYNAIANNGMMVKPFLVSEIQKHEFGKSVVEYKPVIIEKRICSKKTLKKIKGLLEGVVEKGTAQNIKSGDYKIAGKTGTAQIADRKHGYQKIYQSSFVGYFPADKPMFSCIVVINAPKSGAYYGSQVAAPVFKEISDKIFANSIEMHPAINNRDLSDTKEFPYAKVGYILDVQTIYDELKIPYKKNVQSDWVSCAKREGQMELEERQVIQGLVPEVIGMGLKDALYLLGNLGLKVKVIGKGRVRKQSLRVGTRPNRGDIIIIELS